MLKSIYSIYILYHRYISKILPNSRPFTRFEGNLIYLVPKKNLKVSWLFSELERNGKSNGIKDYAVSQTT